ncbi:MAG: hypothetical protein QOE48_1803 [Mycobacterium sp.]|jgi:hypothetical protein|nr:hypothetical protein [Mycobacterium sp.]MDT5306133.1 hypothetical protein [Mycobacterium sp.]
MRALNPKPRLKTRFVFDSASRGLGRARGINSCWELVPDVWDLADDFEVALQELLTAAA